MTTTTRIIIATLAALALAAAGAWYWLHGKEYEYRFSEAGIQQALAERLPMTKRYLLLLQITSATGCTSAPIISSYPSKVTERTTRRGKSG